ncbi:hypothetical protein E4K73_44515 [Streptomyces sp. IB201691-2A2]|nr:hypothetical protein E4K73_44515 [Streptomyces sp. IB201691-2A2]
MAAGNPRGRATVNRVLRPRRPYPSHPWGLRPQTPAHRPERPRPQTPDGLKVSARAAKYSASPAFEERGFGGGAPE